jgi:hypothetical protein
MSLLSSGVELELEKKMKVKLEFSKHCVRSDYTAVAYLIRRGFS